MAVDGRRNTFHDHGEQALSGEVVHHHHDLATWSQDVKRIGFFLDSTDISWLMADLIGKLDPRDDVETVLLVLEDHDSALASEQQTKARGVSSRPGVTARRLLFRIGVQAEGWLGRCLSSKLRRVLGSTQVGGAAVRVGLQLRRVDLRSRAASCDDLVALDLAVVGSGRPTVTDGVLRQCNDGVLRLRYGLTDDQDWYRPAMSALNQEPSTSYVIDIQTSLDEPARICSRGSVATRMSITRNRGDVAAIAHRQLEGLITGYLETGALRQEHGIPIGWGSEAVLEDDVPAVRVMLRYVASSVRRVVVSRLFPRRHRATPEWHVGYVRGAKQIADLGQAVVISNPDGRWFADPFVVERSGRTVCFVEEFSEAELRGCISAIELTDDGGYELLGPVVEEDFHMSFPFVFDFEGCLYMVPETHTTGQVRLYACDSFPMEWRFVGTCLDDVIAVDPLLFEHDGHWWLLCGIPVDAGNMLDIALHVFFSDSPLSTCWKPHALNPVLIDNLNARNGGILFDRDRLPVRVRQSQGFNQYGAGFSLARIETLSATAYQEVEIDRLTVENTPSLLGSHHLNGTEAVMVTDFLMMSDDGAPAPPRIT